MLSISGISLAAAKDYYQKNYYAQEEKGQWFGELKDELDLKKEFNLKEFEALLAQNERFRTYDFKLKIPGSLMHKITDEQKFKQEFARVLRNISREPFKETGIKIRNGVDMIRDRNGHLVCQLTSHTIAKAKWKMTQEKIKAAGLENKFQNEMIKLFNKFDLKSAPENFTFKAVENSSKVGVDLTFSVPKSVSLTMALNDEHFKNIVKAQEMAVNSTLEFVQRELIFSRVQSDNLNFREKTSNMIAARFNHFASRNQDPQLHTHVVVFNSTRCSDGKIRTIDSIDLFQNQILMGKIQANFLMSHLQEMGYPLEITDLENSTFEIKGLSKEHLGKYSSRSQEKNEYLEEYLAKNNRTLETATAKEKQIAVLKTRTRKQEIALDQNLKEWRKQFKVDGIKEPNMEKFISPIIAEVERIFLETKRNLENQKVVFCKNDFINEALKVGCSRITSDQIEKLFHKDSGMYRLGNINGETYFSTPRSIKIEQQIFTYIERGKGNFPCLNPSLFENQLKGSGLTTGEHSQEQALRFITTSTDHIIAIQGDAGTGKTFMLNEARKIFKASGFKCAALAPSNIAAQELRKKAGFEQTFTLHSYLNKLEKEAGNAIKKETYEIQRDWNLIGLQPGKNREVWIVDEASMVENNTMNKILEASERKYAKVILIGDSKQLQPVGAGNSYSNLIHKDHIPYTEMKINLRQMNAPAHIKKAVDFAAQGNIHHSVNELQKNILQIKNNEERIFQIAKDYTQLPKHERDLTTIITCINRDRIELNNCVRELLKSKGELQTSKKFEVTDIKGHTHTREFSIDDKVIFLKSDNLHNIRVNNNQIGEITNIKGHWLTVKTNDKTVQFSTKTYNHLDHAYAKTTYKEQAKTYDRVLLNINTNQKNMNSRNDYYVKISRTKHDLKIYTNNKNELLEAVLEQQKKLDLGDFGFDHQKKTVNHLDQETHQSYLNNLELQSIAKDNSLTIERELSIDMNQFDNMFKKENPLELENEIQPKTLELDKEMDMDFGLSM